MAKARPVRPLQARGPSRHADRRPGAGRCRGRRAGRRRRGDRRLCDRPPLGSAGSRSGGRDRPAGDQAPLGRGAGDRPRSASARACRPTTPPAKRNDGHRIRGSTSQLATARPRQARLLALAALRPSPRCSSSPPPRPRVGPYPSLGSCQVFPDPPASTSPPRPLAAHRGGLEPGHLQGPARPALGRLHLLHPLPRRQLDPPRLRLAARLRHPLRGRRHRPARSCRSTTPPTATRATPGRSRSPPTPRSRAANSAEGDRHVLAVDRGACTLYELYRAHFVAEPQAALGRRLRHRWDLTRPARAPTG